MVGFWSLAGASDQAGLARSSPAQKININKIFFKIISKNNLFFKKNICDFLKFFTAL
jgi:hypothetical protein